MKPLHEPLSRPPATLSPQSGERAGTGVVIAIDGASASGKSTNAKIVARALGFIHVDTGAMYRTLAWYCLKQGVDVHDAEAVSALCARWNATLECPGHAVHLLVDGYHPTREIRTAQVSEATPWVAAAPRVREWMKEKQRQCIQFGNLVMEGRDIGTHVFPEAQFKFYLDASLSERAKRRAAEGIQENIAARDERDTRRAAAPLQIAPDAVVINNSHLTAAQTSALILERIRKELASV
ncbi:MAG: (d)CMP kinase [Verrucomicrobiota bacterium]|jgi:cytidylate kinase